MQNSNKIIYHGEDMIATARRCVASFLSKEKFSGSMADYVSENLPASLNFQLSDFLSIAIRESRLTAVDSKYSSASGYFQILKGTYDYIMTDIIKDASTTDGQRLDEYFFRRAARVLPNVPTRTALDISKHAALDQNRKLILADFPLTVYITDKLWSKSLRIFRSMAKQRHLPVADFLGDMTPGLATGISFLCHHVGVYGTICVVEIMPIDVWTASDLDLPSFILALRRTDLNKAMNKAYKGRVTKWNDAKSILDAMSYAVLMKAAIITEVLPDIDYVLGSASKQ